MPSVVRGNTIRLTLDADPATVEGPTPTLLAATVDIENPSAVLVVTDAEATLDPPDKAYYDFAVSSSAPVGTWTVTWTATVNGVAGQTVEEDFDVTATALDDSDSDHYFTIAEAREFRGGKLGNDTKFPDTDIVDAREEIEQFIEEVCERAFVVRTRTVHSDGSADYELALPDLRVTGITAITVTDSAGAETTYSAEDLADVHVTEYGFIRRRARGYFTAGYGNVAVTYTYGEETPLPIKRAALILLCNRLIPSDISDRAQSFTNESGTLAYSTPNGMQRPTGIPEVDSILWKYSEHRVGIA